MPRSCWHRLPRASSTAERASSNGSTCSPWPWESPRRRYSMRRPRGSPRRRDGCRAEGSHMAEALIVSNAVLWVVVLALCAIVFALARQIGVLHERIAPAGALMLKRGLKIGEPAPTMTLTDVDGRIIPIGTTSASAKIGRAHV